MTYRERRERKVERLNEWAEKREHKSSAEFQKSHDLVAGIPLGQPILVGHHSEKQHRNTIERTHKAAARGLDHARTAERHSEKAANIERQLNTSIYSDDPDAIEQLESKIERLECERTRIKEINKYFRSHKIDLCQDGITPDSALSEKLAPLKITPNELKDIFNSVRFSYFGKGYPPYHLQNLGGNITRNKKRLTSLKWNRDNG